VECNSTSAVEIEIFRVLLQLPLNRLIRFLPRFKALAISRVHGSNGHINEMRIAISLNSMRADISSELRTIADTGLVVTIITTRYVV
jgi:hypothetical protein